MSAQAQLNGLYPPHGKQVRSPLCSNVLASGFAKGFD